jgi:hypothetical protein
MEGNGKRKGQENEKIRKENEKQERNKRWGMYNNMQGREAERETRRKGEIKIQGEKLHPLSLEGDPGKLS